MAIKDGFYGFDDALYVGIRICAKWQNRANYYRLLTACPQYATPELRIFCPDDEKFSVMKRIENYVSMKASFASVTLIDGVRVRFDDGWWLVRASNTEAALVARAEGKTPEILRRLVKDIESTLSNAGLKWTGPKYSRTKFALMIMIMNRVQITANEKKESN